MIGAFEHTTQGHGLNAGPQSELIQNFQQTINIVLPGVREPNPLTPHRTPA